MPDQLIFGKPYILDVCVVSGRSVAESRDVHYHKPPFYLVTEPEDTTSRTRNLQQTNTNGLRWQGTPQQLEEAKQVVENWGPEGNIYRPTPEYQALLRQLLNRFPYRLDTNFAKIDRIVHPEIEAFKERIMATQLHGFTLAQWMRLLNKASDEELRSALAERFAIRDEDAGEIIS